MNSQFVKNHRTHNLTNGSQFSMLKASLAQRGLECIGKLALVSRCRDVALLTCLATAAQAGPAPFDLAGPVVEVKITRAGQTLPVFEVPNLSVGDQIWIKADLPSTQSAHFLLVIDSLSNDKEFAHPVLVPDGFLGSALPVPHPGAGPLYVKLRDDAAVLNLATLSARQLPVTSGELERSVARQPALVGVDNAVIDPSGKSPSPNGDSHRPAGSESATSQPDAPTVPQNTQPNSQ